MRKINYDFGKCFNEEQQLDLWGKLVYKSKVNFGKKYINVLREDKNPGCFFTIYNGLVCLVDFCHNPKTITLYSALKELYPEENFNTLIEENINKELISRKSYEKIKSELYFDKLPNLTDRCRKYYNTYGINSLEKVNGYSVFKFFCNRYIDIYPEICVGFELQNNRNKIYFPLREENKWFSNTNENNYWFIEGNDSLYISTSHKDILVIHNLTGASVFSPMSETMKYTDHQIKLISKYDKIYVVGDGDKEGQKFNNYNKELINAVPIDITEYSDITNKYGKKCKDISEIYRLDRELCRNILIE